MHIGRRSFSAAPADVAGFFRESGLLDGDGPAGVGDPVEVGDGIAVLSGPLRDRLGGLSAVEVGDEFVTGLETGHRILGFDEGEGADLAVGFEYLLHTVL